jgi:hypothetical protein
MLAWIAPRLVTRFAPSPVDSRDIPDASLARTRQHGGMQIAPTPPRMPGSLIFALCPPIVVAVGWLLLVTAPDALDGLGQILLGMALGFLASIASIPALVISIKAVRSGDAHRGVSTVALVGNALVTLQTASIVLGTAAYQVFW